MPSKRLILALVVGLVVLGGGLIALGVVGTPAVDDVSNTFGEVTEDETVIKTDILIENPNPIGLGLDAAEVTYSVGMNEIHMANGSVDDVSIERGETAIPAKSTLKNEAIPEWWLSHVERGEQTDVIIDATLMTDRFDRSVDYTHTTAIETDILDGIRSDEQREINADHALASDPMLYINETDASWAEPTDSETPVEKTFLFYNPNTEPYALSQVGYEITMNDVSVGEGETDSEVFIEGHSEEELDLTTAIDVTSLDEWWITHLDESIHGHQVSQFRIEFWATVELPGGEEITIEVEELTYEEFIGTDIFDEGGDVGDVPDDDSSDSGDIDDTSDDADDTTEHASDDADDSTDDANDDETDDSGDDDVSDDSSNDDDGLLDDGL